MLKKHHILFMMVCLIGSSCATYYQQNREFYNRFQSGKLDAAERTLLGNKQAEESKERFLYYLNLGVVTSMQGKYEESNLYFEKAYLFGEDYQINYVNEAASYLTNPNFVLYKGEDHEHLLLLYYKAMNYLKMGDKESALIECRRLNIRLNQLSDKYRSDDKFQRDGFIHMLMGIIYDANKDYNNAFIAYRNALNIYNTDYKRLFGIGPPEQLKKDLLRSAFLTGFKDEFEQYKQEFGMLDYEYKRNEGGELIFLWNNGLGPVKAEWSLNFAVLPGQGGWVNFTNNNYSYDFPFRLDDEDDETDLRELEFFRVAFPKYVERPKLYSEANLITNGERYQLQLAEDVNAIAFKSLEQRMVSEFGRSLLRAALKKAAEKKFRKENEGLGALVGIVNAATEKADTRNWQTVPHSIYYARVPLKEGENKVEFSLRSFNNPAFDSAYEFIYNVEKGETLFHTFSSLESQRVNLGHYY
ncbi:MAG: hypothetical protein AAFX87_16310 [Bacteroidota bacterium]